MLRIEDLHVYYGNVHAVKNVSFRVNKGEIVALLGANGAGKTTIIKAITGQIRSKQGRILLCSEDITKLPSFKRVRKGIACVPEGRELFPGLTVRENLLMGAFNLGEAKVKEKLEEVYCAFPILGERRNQLAGTLSGGEQQMVAIARGLMSVPSVMLLDEPSLGLAPIIADSVFEVCRQLRDKGITLMLVEQNASKALAISDRAYVLETGTIKIHGNSIDLLKDAEVKKAYLGGDRGID